MAGLSSKQKRFALEYVKCGNASEAARTAGYTNHRSEQAAYQLLQNPWVKAEVDRLQAKLEREGEVDAKYVIRNLKAVVERCMESDGKFDAAGANKALESLGRTLGLFVDKKQVDGGFTHQHASIADKTPAEQHKAAAHLMRTLQSLGIGVDDEEVTRN